MEKEQVAVDEAVETVAEENARGYSKTVWNESTPITADKLNKMETGIANGIDKSEQIMTIPIVSPEGWQQFRWTMPNYNTISWTRDAPGKKAIEIYNETARQRLLLLDDNGILNTYGSIILPNSTKGQIKQTLSNGTITPTLYITSNDNLRVGSADIENVCIYSKTNPKTSVAGSTYTLYHTGNFNPATKLDAGAFTVHDRDLRIHGKRAMVGFNTADGDYLELNYGRDFAAGVKIQGLTRTEAIENGGNLAFSNFGRGGGLNTNVHNLALHSATGNGQMITAADNKVFVGNPNTPLYIESSINPNVNVGGRVYQLYHTGNKPTAWDIGAMSTSGPTFEGNLNQNGPGGKDWIYHINADRGTLNIAPKENGSPNWGKQIFIDRNGQLHCNGNRRVATINQENPAHHMIRYGAGMGGADGYITFSW